MKRPHSSRALRWWPLLLAICCASLCGCATVSAAPPAPDRFEELFTGRTMRWDYYHCGTAGREHIARDGFRLEGPWPGSRTRLIDDTNLGLYFLEVIDEATGEPIFSRGFCSIFGEWVTTGEAAKGAWRAFHESLRFPEPKSRAQLRLKTRGPDQSFQTIHLEMYDPEGHDVDRSPLPAGHLVRTVIENGPVPTSLDLLVLGDGYTANEMDKFHDDVDRLLDALFQVEPFAAHKDDFNVRTIDLPAAESGITQPKRGIWRHSPLGLAYDAFGTDRYVLTYENRAVREAAAQAPYDALVIVFNNQRYGGGGIFNLWATVAADTPTAPGVLVHELGHSLAGLADEYFSRQVAYELDHPITVEPWEPNITALLDPENLKWADLVEPDTPIPTPWNRPDGARRGHGHRAPDEAGHAAPRAERFDGKTGAFEGASYQPKGLYRPAVECLMKSRARNEFCAVCRRAIARAIEMYTE